MKTVGICGAGQMGAAAAVSFQRAGYPVILWARDPRKLPSIRKTLARLDAWLNRNAFGVPPLGGIRPVPTKVGTPNTTIELTSDLATIDGRADLVIDCIAEDMGEKIELFRALPLARRRKAIFITTTSGLSITRMGRGSGTARHLVGAHFWNPPHLMPLVEVIRGQDTSDAAMKTVVGIIRSLGKIPVRVNRDVPGFVGNRLLHAMWREAINLVQRGIASPEDVDRVARLTFGLRVPAVGPLENMDLVGLDLVKDIHGYLLADLADDHKPLPLLEKLVKQNRRGMKNGRGFHDWRTRDPKELIERRDRQIVRQLQFLREVNAL